MPADRGNHGPAAGDHETTDGLSLGLSAAFQPPEPAVEVLPDRLGPYRVHGLLGEGGMGRVYRASEEFPRRDVALKVLRPGMASRSLVQRFEREAHLLGRLQHDGIAKVYSAGTLDEGPRPIPYIAMELVEGVSLDRWLRETRPAREGILDLIASVAEAVHHAHLKGVMHRDLKPGNILVTADGSPKIVDFGIARDTDREALSTLETRAGQIVGTLPYMAPEQVDGAPDAMDSRVDVYALGVLLYRCLSGELPLDVTECSLATAVIRIVEEEPRPLRSLDASFRGDLDVITARALAKDPERRYASAAALAEDLRRHLRFEPVLARPATAFYQLSRLARRHRIAFGLAAALIAALIAGISGTLVYAKRSRQGQAQAEAERDLKARVNSILAANLGQASPFHRGGSPRAADNLEEIERQLQQGLDGDPELVLPLRIALARGYLDMGRYAEGLRNLDLIEPLILSVDAARAEEGVEADMVRYQILMGMDRVDEARALIERTLEICSGRSESGGADVLRLEGDLLRCALFVERPMDAPERAEAIYRRRRAQLGALDDLTIDGLALVSLAHSQIGELSEAIEWSERQVEASELAYGPLHGLTLYARLDLGSLVSWSGDTKRATELLSDLSRDANRVFGDDPWVQRTIQQAVGSNHTHAERHEEAAAVLRDAVDASERTVGRFHASTLMCKDQLGLALRAAARYEEALEVLDSVRRDREQHLGPDHADLGGSWTAIAVTQRMMGDFAGSLESFEKARANGNAHYPRDHDLVLWTDTGMGRLLNQMGRFDESVELFEEIVPLRAKQLGTGDPTYLNASRQLGDAFSGAGRWEDALAVYRRCRNTALPPGWTHERWTQPLLWEEACCLRELGRFDEELETLQSLALQLDASPDADPDLLERTRARLAAREGSD